MDAGDEQTESVSPAKGRSRLALPRAVLFGGTVALVPPWAFGQAARDDTWLTGLCFYIPSAVPAVLLAAWALAWLAMRRWHAAALAACLAVPPLAVVLFVENRPFAAPPPEQPGRLRLIHWNVGNRLARPGAADDLLARRADVYVLSEVPDARAVEAFRDALGPGYTSRVFANLAVVGTGDVRDDGWRIDRGRVKVRSAAWNGVTLLVVDLPSELHVARDPLLREVNALVERHRPDLVVGDFNAPRRSRGLCELPVGYGHAYDAAGAGFGYTWPVPLPVYALDQCVVSPRVVPARYELHSSWHSDHCMQVLDFTLSPGG